MSVENSTMITSSTECRFCARYASASSFREPWDQRLLETEHFVVVPTKGALIPGWLLIVPREHSLAFSATTENVDELESLLADTCDLVGKTFGVPTIFEHGATKPGTHFGCGIDHAHLHVAPLPFRLNDAAQRFDRTMRWSEQPAPWRRGVVECPYLAIKNINEPWLGAEPSAIPRQFFRRVIAHELGLADQFDYDANPFSERVHETVRASLVQTDARVAV